jgi:transcriptional regulator with XRE-family HTH domain
MSGSPAVRRRRLAAELRRLRGSRTGSEVASALHWSLSKVSRYEQGRDGLPLDEVEKLLEHYGVTDPMRAQLLSLAHESNQRGWWESYSDAISAEYQNFIGLEAEAASLVQWQIALVPGLLQTADYARQLHLAYQGVEPIAPGTVDRRVEVRMIRQKRLTDDPLLQFNAVIDESVLLRQIGDRKLMHAQLQHLLQMAELPNVELRVLRLGVDRSMMADSFAIFSFNPIGDTGKLHDVVSAEALVNGFYVESETHTYLHRVVFNELARISLSVDASSDLIRRTAKRRWA